MNRKKQRTIITLTLFIAFIGLGVIGCSGSSSDVRMATEALLKDKVVKIPYKQYPATSVEGAKKWLAFFYECKEKGFMEIRPSTKDAAIFAYFKDEFRKEFGYQSPKNGFDPCYCLTAATIRIEDVDIQDSRSGKFLDVSFSLVSYKGKIEYNEIGKLMIKHGLIPPETEASGVVSLQKYKDGEWRLAGI